MFLVALVHVEQFSGHAGAVFAGMGGHRLLVEVERDQRVAGVQFQCLAHVLVWNRENLSDIPREPRCSPNCVPARCAAQHST